MVRGILGLVVGVVVAVALVFVGELALHAISPVEAPAMNDPEAMKAFMASVPLSSKIGLIVVYLIAAFGGSLVGAWVGRRGWSGWGVAVVLALFGAANFFMLPHPLWIVAASMAAYAMGGWLGTRQGLKMGAKA